VRPTDEQTFAILDGRVDGNRVTFKVMLTEV
jgi:hypothetical protein